MTEREELERAINSLEAQRAGLGDEVVDAALVPLHQKLAALGDDARQQKSPPRRERRVVTVLFCDVTGSTTLAEQMDPEEWAAVMDAAFKRLIESVERYGGMIARLMGDAILAFFGAPEAHEDDPRRAVAAGLAILEQVGDYRKRLKQERGIDFNVRVGINTGLAVVGEIGTEIHGEYTAMGDAVNVAARMEQTAKPGTLQISEQTYRLVEPYFECHPLGKITVKGKSEPQAVYRVLGHKDQQPAGRLVAHGIEAPLIGRDREFAQAREAFEKLLNGQGGIITVTGEAGIGKSRLVAELRQGYETENLTWLEGRTMSYGQTISYWPFLEMTRRYLGISEEDSEAEAWHKLEAKIVALFPENTAEILPYLATLLSIEVSDSYSEHVKYLDGEAMGDQILVSSRRFFMRLAQERPLVLVFEDLHWMDDSSARLLERLLLLAQTEPLLFIGLSRPEAEKPTGRLQEIAAGQYGERYIEINLTPLSEAHSAQLVNSLLAIDALPLRIRETILNKADGNPFYLEEIIRNLIEAGAVVQDRSSGRWRAGATVETVAIPDTIRGVIMARIDRLDGGAKRVLNRAAVIGRSFLYRVLRAVVESGEQLDQHLLELKEVELIREKQKLPELEYIFKHVLAQEATYESILLQERKVLHVQVARAIETLFVDRRDEFFGLLAYHYSRAEEWAKAQEYLLKAGNQAADLAAGAEVLAHYRQAMSAYERAFGSEMDAGHRGSLYRRMGEAYYGLGHLEESRQRLQEAAAVLGYPMPQSQPGRLVSLAVLLFRQVLHRLRPAMSLESATEAKKANLIEAILVYERLMQVAYLTGQIPTIYSLYVWLRNLNLAGTVGPSPELARAYALSSIALAQFGLRSLAAMYSRLAMETIPGMDEPNSLASIMEYLGIYNIIIGRWKKAEEALEEGLAINERLGSLRKRDDTWGVLGAMAYQQSDFGRSNRLSEKMFASGQERGDWVLQLWGLCGQAENGLRLGRENHAEEAVAFLLETQSLLASHQNVLRPSQIWVYGLLSQAYWRNSEVELAWNAAETALRLIDEEFAPSTLETFEGYAGPPCVFLHMWEEHIVGALDADGNDELQKLARRACKGLRGYGRVFAFGQPRAWLWQGLYEWLDGKPDKAQQAWGKSLTHAEELDMAYEQGLTHYEIGRHLPGDDPRREEHLKQAVNIFSRLDTVWDLEQAQKTLTRLEIG